MSITTAVPIDPVLVAEHYVIGMILAAPSCFDEALAQLDASDFYSPDYSAIFTAMCAARDDGAEVSLPATAHRVESTNRESLLDLLVACEADLRLFPKSGTTQFGKPVFESCLELVANNSARRRVAAKAAQVPSELDKPGSANPGEVQRIAQEVADVAQQRRAKVVSGPDDAMDDIRAALDPAERATGLSTGYPELNDLGVRLAPGSLTIVAARPSIGKSSFATSIAHDIAVRRQVRTLIVSLEVSRRDVIRNVIHAGAMAAHERPLPEQELRLREVAERYAKSPLFVNDVAGLSSADLNTMIRRAVISHGVEVVIVDYLQLLKREDKKRSREEEVASQSLLLKTVARECGIAVVLLCQLNREAESRTTGGGTKKLRGVPRLSDLRESGAIEQDADAVLLLYRQAVYNETNPDPRVRQDGLVIVAKNRSGPTGHAKIDFIPAATAWVSPLRVTPTSTPPPELPL